MSFRYLKGKPRPKLKVQPEAEVYCDVAHIKSVPLVKSLEQCPIYLPKDSSSVESDSAVVVPCPVTSLVHNGEMLTSAEPVVVVCNMSKPSCSDELRLGGTQSNSMVISESQKSGILSLSKDELPLKAACPENEPFTFTEISHCALPPTCDLETTGASLTLLKPVDCMQALEPKESKSQPSSENLSELLPKYPNMILEKRIQILDAKSPNEVLQYQSKDSFQNCVLQDIQSGSESKNSKGFVQMMRPKPNLIKTDNSESVCKSDVANQTLPSFPVKELHNGTFNDQNSTDKVLNNPVKFLQNSNATNFAAIHNAEILEVCDSEKSSLSSFTLSECDTDAGFSTASDAGAYSLSEFVILNANKYSDGTSSGVSSDEAQTDCVDKANVSNACTGSDFQQGKIFKYPPPNDQMCLNPCVAECGNSLKNNKVQRVFKKTPVSKKPLKNVWKPQLSKHSDGHRSSPSHLKIRLQEIIRSWKSRVSSKKSEGLLAAFTNPQTVTPKSKEELQELSKCSMKLVNQRRHVVINNKIHLIISTFRELTYPSSEVTTEFLSQTVAPLVNAVLPEGLTSDSLVPAEIKKQTTGLENVQNSISNHRETKGVHQGQQDMAESLEQMAENKIVVRKLRFFVIEHHLTDENFRKSYSSFTIPGNDHMVDDPINQTEVKANISNDSVTKPKACNLYQVRALLRSLQSNLDKSTGRENSIDTNGGAVHEKLGTSKLPILSKSNVLPKEVSHQLSSMRLDKSWNLKKPNLSRIVRTPRYTMTTFGKMGQLARSKLVNKFGNKTPDPSDLTMMDFIFYNPKSNPMEELSRAEETTSQIASLMASASSGTIPLNDPVPDPVSLVPQLKLSGSGGVTLDQSSTSINETSPDITILEEESTNTCKKRPYSKRQTWSPRETAAFYDALLKCGSDFEQIRQSAFPDRARKNLKYKFKREEKLRRHLIDKVIFERVPLTAKEIEQHLGHKSDDSLSETESAVLQVVNDKLRCPSPAIRKGKGTRTTRQTQPRITLSHQPDPSHYTKDFNKLESLVTRRRSTPGEDICVEELLAKLRPKELTDATPAVDAVKTTKVPEPSPSPDVPINQVTISLTQSDENTCPTSENSGVDWNITICHKDS